MNLILVYIYIMIKQFKYTFPTHYKCFALSAVQMYNARNDNRTLLTAEGPCAF